MLRARGARKLLANEDAPAVLLPATLARFQTRGLFLAVADRADAACRNGHGDEEVLDGVGALLAQTQVVLGGAALVAMSFNHHTHLGMRPQEFPVALQRGALIVADLVLVVIEVDD